MSKMHVPGYIEIVPGEYKATLDCNYAEVLSAQKLESDWRRRASIGRLVRRFKARWNESPSLTVARLLQ